MKFSRFKSVLCKKRLKVNSFNLYVFFLIFFISSSLQAQQLKSSFVLDTTKTQIFPYDLDFSLKLIDSKSTRIKYVYLIRIGTDGKVRYDKQTSFYRLGQVKDAKQNILKKIKNDIIEANDSINKYSNDIPNWKQKLRNNEMLLSNETDVEKIKDIKNKINTFEFDIRKYNEYKKFLDSFYKNPKAYIKKAKSQPRLSPLKIIGREKDTLIVKINALKPNKEYIILAVNEVKKTKALKELIQKYLNFGYVEDKEVTIISSQYLPKNRKEKYKLNLSKPLAVIEKVDKPSNEIKFTIPAKIFKEEFNIAKEKNIDSLLAINSKKPNLIKINDLKTPDPFKYPIEDKWWYFHNDSLVTSVPDSFNNDFRLVNGIISEFRNHGDSIVTGKYALIEEQNRSLKVNFKPKSDLNSQLNTITKTLDLASKAQQSIFVLAEAEIDNYERFESYFSSLIDKLSKNRDILAKRVEAQNKVNAILSGLKLPYGIETQTLEKSTYSYQFLTRNSGVIKQSFGFVYYFSDKQDFSGLAPYTGVDFQLRSTNENTKFWKIKDWKKFVSLQLGIPLFASELNEGSSRKHLVGDAFSIYTGLGINLGHSVKIGYGAVLFRSIDGSAVNGTNNYKINSVHGISIGVNFKLIPLFKNIFGSNKVINLIE